MINIKLKSVFLGLITLISAVTLSGSPTCSIVVHAEEETLGEELQRDLKWLYDKSKEQGGKAASWAAENAPKAVDKVKEEVPKLIEDDAEASRNITDGLSRGEFILLGVLIALAVLIGVVLGGFIMAKILLRNPRHKQ